MTFDSQPYVWRVGATAPALAPPVWDYRRGTWERPFDGGRPTNDPLGNAPPPPNDDDDVPSTAAWTADVLSGVVAGLVVAIVAPVVYHFVSRRFPR